MLGVVTVAAFSSGFAFYPNASRQNTEPGTSVSMPGFFPAPKPLQDFTLSTTAGRPFGIGDLRGRVTLLVAGYTHCPDVCPTALSVLRETLDRWRDDAGDGNSAGPVGGLQVAFLSVDPARDTPDRLSSYLGFFDDTIVGLTGTDEEIATLGSQIGLYYARQAADENGGYSVDHTASFVLIDDRARLVALLSPPHEPARIAELAGKFANPAH